MLNSAGVKKAVVTLWRLIVSTIAASEGTPAGMIARLTPLRSAPQISKIEASKEIGASCRESMLAIEVHEIGIAK